MGDCHINIIADFSDDFGLKLDLQGRTLLGVEGSKGRRVDRGQKSWLE